MTINKDEATFYNGRWYDRAGRPLTDVADPLRVGVDLTATGQTVVAGVAGKRIRVLATTVNALIATTVRFLSNASNLSASIPLADKGGSNLPETASGWFETNVGEALNLSMTVNTTVGVQVIYALV